MKRFVLLFFQLLIIFSIIFLVTKSDYKIDFYWNGIIFTSTTSFILILLILIIIVILIIQRVYLYVRFSPRILKNNMQIRKYQKGIDAISKSITAIANNDNKELINQSKKIDYYLKDNPISLILHAESARKQKKYVIAENYYNKMLLDPNTKTLGLRGLLEQNIKSQDYHHALIYAEQIYNINAQLEWIYPTIIEILVKTRNWQKMIEINNNAQYQKIVSKDKILKSNAIAYYEIALIKESFSIREALQSVSKANAVRPNFPPIVKKYINLLINDNQISKAKKILYKLWSAEPHPMFIEEIENISQKENTKISFLIKKLIKNNPHHYESRIFNAKAFIDEKNWEEAKKTIQDLLSSRPSKTICELMAEIEKGITGNEQKANSWKNRSKLGDLEKTWVCKHTGNTQNTWSSISQEGFFDSLEWTWPDTNYIKDSKKTGIFIPDIIGTI